MTTVLHRFRLLLLVLCLAAPAFAADERGLAERTEDLKQQVLDLNRELFVLEEELLFPATTQFAVFLSVDVGEFFQLDSVQLKIDDEVVTNYLYTEREADALRRGGVQRLYTGNLASGQHELVALFIGKGPGEREYRRGAQLSFEKALGSKYVELKILDSEAAQQPEFVAKEWD